MNNHKLIILAALLLLSSWVSAQSVIEYKVQMRWVPESNSLSISENAVGLPPDCEECFAPIESIECGYNLTAGQLNNGQDACFTDDDEAGFGVVVNFNNAANCTSESQPYKAEWAIFVNNIPNGFTGARTANMHPIDELTTLTISCEVGTAPLKVLKTESIPLNDVLYDATAGALYFDTTYGYDLLTGNKRHHSIKTKMDVMKSQRVEYRIRMHETELLVLASTSRESIEIAPPKSHVNPRYDVWVAITDSPVDMNGYEAVQPINNGKCDSLASNDKYNRVALNLSSSGEDGTCFLDGRNDYWLVWYILDKGPVTE